MNAGHLEIRPITQKQAKSLVGEWYRHHKAPRGDRFHIGAKVNGSFVGAIMVGRPVARMTEQYQIADAIRCVTNGYKNGCSKLYASAARIAKEMGYNEIQTFILESESGVSLLAAGWTLDSFEIELPCGTKLKLPKKFGGGSWNRPSRGGRRDDQPQEFKHRWFRSFK